MTTTNTKTVIPAGGGDYSTLSAWEADRNADLVTADYIEIANCSGATNDTTVVVFLGWTTNSTHYAQVNGDITSEVWDESKYVFSPVADYAVCIDIQAHFIYLNKLQIKRNGGGGARYIITTNTGTDSENCRISNCIFTMTAGSGTTGGIDCSGDSDGTIIWNCIFYDLSGVGIFAGGTGTSIYNCTIYGGTIGINKQSYSVVSIISKNNLVTNTSTADFASGGASGTMVNTNCASEDETADDFAGSGNRVTQTFSFISVAGDDYGLLSTDLGAKEYGVTNPGSGLFSDDIIGTARPVDISWDIGAFEAPTSGEVVIIQSIESDSTSIFFL